MKTLLFPGGSLKNKIWAEQIKEHLAPDLTIEIIHWSHWSNGQDDNLDLLAEINRSAQIMTAGPFMVIAKSIGSYVSLGAINKSGHWPEKLILCGIPLGVFDEEMLKQYQILSKLDGQSVICLQNEHDPKASYAEVKSFLARINPQIEVVMKPGDTHEYPFPDEFRDFLLSKITLP